MRVTAASASHATPPPPGRATASTARTASVIVLLIGLCVGAILGRASQASGAWGTKDFIEYWAAFQIAEAGGNPYSAPAMLAVEQAAGRIDPTPVMMWNPPWLLELLRPILAQTMRRSAAIWISANIVLATAACLLIAHGFRREALTAGDLIPAMIGSVVSFPAVLTIQLGQVSLLLLFGVALLYWGLRRGHDIAAGLALMLLSVKPHLFVMVVALVAIVVIRDRRWRIVASAVAATGAIVLITWLRSASLLSWWVESLSGTPDGVPAAVTWRTPNLPNVVRDLAAHWTGNTPSWPLTVIPIAALVCGAFWMWRRSHHRSLDELFPMVLCLSVITAPFGWTFDHVVLAVPQVIITMRAFTLVERTTQRWALVFMTLLCHVALVMQLALTGTDYSALWWYPLAVLAIWMLSSAWTRHNSTELTTAAPR